VYAYNTANRALPMFVLAPRVDRDIELALSHLMLTQRAERLVVSDPAVTREVTPLRR